MKENYYSPLSFTHKCFYYIITNWLYNNNISILVIAAAIGTLLLASIATVLTSFFIFLSLLSYVSSSSLLPLELCVVSILLFLPLSTLLLLCWFNILLQWVQAECGSWVLLLLFDNHYHCHYFYRPYRIPTNWSSSIEIY